MVGVAAAAAAVAALRGRGSRDNTRETYLIWALEYTTLFIVYRPRYMMYSTYCVAQYLHRSHGLIKKYTFR